MLTFIVIVVSNWGMSKEKPDVMKERAEKARAVLAERRDAENSLEVSLQVKDLEHARSQEVVTFATEHLASGGTWNALRIKLGLGPAWKDHRWRMLRQLLVDTMLPENEEEALKAMYAKNQFIIDKIESMTNDIDDYIEAIPSATSHLLKIKLDSLKALAEQNEIQFEAYLNMKKLKVVEKASQGVSIIFQNNFHVPRPGDNSRDVTPALEGDTVE